MLTIFIYVLFQESFFITNEMKQLYKKALQSKVSNPEVQQNEEIEHEGFHKLGPVSFYLTTEAHSPGTYGVNGYAISSKKDMLYVLNGEMIKPNHIFLKGKRILQVNNVYESYKGGKFFNTSIINNPLEVMTNLKMKTGSPSDLKGLCDLFLKYFPHICDGVIDFSWDMKNDRPSEYLNYSDMFTLYLGARGKSKASCFLQYKFPFSAKLNYIFDFSLKTGIGFKLKQEIDLPTIPDKFKEPISFAIYEFTAKFLGMEVSVNIRLIMKPDILKLLVNIPKEVVFIRCFEVLFSKSGYFSGSGHKNIAQSIKIDPSSYSSILPKETFEFKDVLGIRFNALIDFAFEAKFIFGPIESFITVGVEVDTLFSFGANVQKCVCPYVYGTIEFKVIPFFKVTPLKLFGYNILPYLNLTYPYSLVSVPKFCLFSSEKSQEGQKALQSTQKGNAYIVNPYLIKLTNFEVSLKVIAIDENSSPICSIDFKKISDKTTNNRKMIFTNVKKIPYLLFEGFYTIKGKTETHPIKLSPMNLVLGPNIFETDFGEKKSGTFSISITVIEAKSVEIFKEFAGNKNNKIVFKPSGVPLSSRFGLISHDVLGKEYSASLLDYDYYDEINYEKGAFTTKSQMIIKLESIKQKTPQNLDINMKFSLCIDGKCQDIEQMDMSLVTNQIYTSKDFKFLMDNFIQFPGANGVFVVEITSNTLKASYRISQSELEKEEKFVYTINDKNFEIGLNVRRKISNIEIDFGKQMGENERGIVSRVYNCSKKWTGEKVKVEVNMHESEQYGILVFETKEQLPKGETIACIIHADNFMPLCKSTIIDKDKFLIMLEHDQTLYNYNSIHIPFRRKDIEDKDFDATLLNIFTTSIDTKCGKGFRTGTQIKYIGCFEGVEVGKSNILEYQIIDKEESDYLQQEINGEQTKWTLRLFDVSKIPNQKVSIVPSLIEFPEDSTDIAIDSEIIDFYLKHKNKKLSIKCKRCDKVRIVYKNQKEATIQKINEKFSFAPEFDGNILASALCDEPTNSLCIFQESFENDGLALLEYGDAEGVDDLETKDEFMKLSNNVKYQMVYMKPKANLSKVWKGEIKRIAKNLKPNEIILNYFICHNKTINVSAKFGKLDVPFSANKLSINPKKLLSIIGFNNPKDEQKGEQQGEEKDQLLQGCRTTENGEIIMLNGFTFNEKNIQFDQIHEVFDIPKSHIIKVSYTIKNEDKKESSKTPYIIISTVCVLAISIAIAIGIIIGNKFKGKGSGNVIGE